MLARSHGQWSSTVCGQVLQPYRANPPRWGYKTSKKSDAGPQKRAVRAAYSLPPFKKIVLIKRHFQEWFVGGTRVADGKLWGSMKEKQESPFAFVFRRVLMRLKPCERYAWVFTAFLAAQHQAAFGIWGLHVELCCSGDCELLSPCIIPYSLHSSGSKV